MYRLSSFCWIYAYSTLLSILRSKSKKYSVEDRKNPSDRTTIIDTVPRPPCTELRYSTTLLIGTTQYSAVACTGKSLSDLPSNCTRMAHRWYSSHNPCKEYRNYCRLLNLLLDWSILDCHQGGWKRTQRAPKCHKQIIPSRHVIVSIISKILGRTIVSDHQS